MEIIKVRNADYALYEELLLRRDQMRKEAHIWQGLYVKEFGDLMMELFERQIACIRKKKLIGYYQAAVNRGKPIDQDEIDRMLREEMENYEKRLQEMIDENEAAKNMSRVSEGQLLEIRKIYHRLAKQLHPDINPKTAEIPELMALWNMAVTAYNSNSLEDMQEVELLVNRALERLGMGITEIDIPDLPAKIKAVEAEIQKIIDTDPYQYKFLLNDKDAVEEKKQDLLDQIANYSEYEDSLDAAIEDLLKDGVKFIWKMK